MGIYLTLCGNMDLYLYNISQTKYPVKVDGPASKSLIEWWTDMLHESFNQWRTAALNNEYRIPYLSTF